MASKEEIHINSFSADGKHLRHIAFSIWPHSLSSSCIAVHSSGAIWPSSCIAMVVDGTVVSTSEEKFLENATRGITVNDLDVLYVCTSSGVCIF